MQQKGKVANTFLHVQEMSLLGIRTYLPIKGIDVLWLYKFSVHLFWHSWSSYIYTIYLSVVAEEFFGKRFAR